MVRYITFNTSLELLCFLVACLCLVKDRQPAWRGMIFYLLITFIAETAAIWAKQPMPGTTAYRSNIWIYNLLLVFQASFIGLLFSHLIGRYTKSGPLVMIGIALLSILYITELLEHGVYEKHIITTKVASVLYIVYGLIFFYYMLKDDESVPLLTHAAFWWVAGLLLHSFGTMARNIFYEELNRVLLPSGMALIKVIYWCLNFMLYSCWSYAFICRKWTRFTSSY